MSDPAIYRRLDALERAASQRPDRLYSLPAASWTPAVEGSSAAGIGTYSVQLGRWLQLGTMVVAWIYLTWSAHTGTGNMTVTLPVASTAANSMRFGVPIWLSDIAFTGAHVQGQIIGGASIINLEAVAATGTRTAIPMDTAGALIITAAYETA